MPPSTISSDTATYAASIRAPWGGVIASTEVSRIEAEIPR